MGWNIDCGISPHAWHRLGIPTWWRYLFLRFALLVSLLSVLGFGLFVFADILAHIKDVADPDTSWNMWRTYYLCMLSCRLQELIPFAVAAATALLIPRIVRDNELIPLLNAGVSLKQIFRPFLAVAFLSSMSMWVNTQYVLPTAIRHHRRIVDSDFGRKTVHEESSRLGVVLFPDSSRLFFFKHNPINRTLFDVFWVRSADYVLHVERLAYFKDRPPEGYGVDVIERDSSGKMAKTASHPFYEMAEIQFTRSTVKMSTADPRDLSLSQLVTLMSSFGSSRSQRATETTIAFYTKLLTPLLAILAVLIPAPFCFRFEKRYPQAVLVFGSLAALFCFHLIIHASVILSRIPFVRPTPFLLIPWVIAFFLAMRIRSKAVYPPLA